MAKQIMLTVEGLQKLEEELEYLKTKKRKEVAEKIKEARGFGDLSENAEYDEAKNEQNQVESRIIDLENMLKNAAVIDQDEVEIDKVGIGTRVKVYDVDFEEEIEYSIVGSTEADPDKNKISNESPVGKAILGKKVGDAVEVSTPTGDTFTLKILEINK
ncbi:MAG: transcription elongation factor GreA [Ruminococcaceae bacterium]|nr:transcription elongation factor GreA [Oscillospiraceae bacterium]